MDRIIYKYHPLNNGKVPTNIPLKPLLPAKVRVGIPDKCRERFRPHFIWGLSGWLGTKNVIFGRVDVLSR